MLPPDLIAGIDASGQEIIRERFSALWNHLDTLLPPDHVWRINPHNLEARQALKGWLRDQDEQHVGSPFTHSKRTPDFAAYRSRLQRWQTTYLEPLAETWQLQKPILAAILAECVKHGWLGTWDAETETCKRPTLTEDMLTGILSLVKTVPFKTSEKDAYRSRVVQLQQRGFCAGEEGATEVAERLDDRVRKEKACDLAYGIVMSVCDNDVIGLLQASGHRDTRLLLTVERQRTWILRLGASPDYVLPHLRQDVCALFHSLTHLDEQIRQWRQDVLAALPKANRRTRSAHLHTDPTRADYIASLATYLGCHADHAAALYRAWVTTKIDVPRLWHEDMLHQPPGAPQRQTYAQIFIPELQQVVLSHLSNHLSCEPPEAQDVWQHFADGGLDRLTEWHSQRCVQVTTTIYQHKRQDILDQTLAGLAAEQQQEATTLVDHIEAAAQSTGIALPMLRLLRERPGSAFRKGFGRWLRSGGSAFHIYHRPARRNRRDIVIPQQRMSLDEWEERQHATQPDEEQAAETDQEETAEVLVDDAEPVVGSPQEALAQELSRRLGFDLPVTRNMLTQLGLYGAVGPLLRTDLFGGIDADLVEYMRFIKFGRLPGSVSIAALHQQMTHLAVVLNKDEPSIHLVHAMFNLISKPRHWNAGVGRTVERVHRRKTRTGRPRLFQCWQVFSLPLKLTIVDDLERVMGTTCHVVVVFDQMLERVMGLWTSVTPPGASEVGLALFEAVWHPGWRDWCVRGIPEHIEVSTKLCAEIPDNLQFAADSMLATITISDESPTIASLRQRKHEHDQIAMLFHEGAAYVRTDNETHAVTLQQVQEALLSWCAHERWFPNHSTALVPEDWVLTLPGETLPVAGWLLPATQIGHEHDRLPTPITACVQQGHTLRSRAAPPMYMWAVPGTFIECSICGYLVYVQ